MWRVLSVSDYERFRYDYRDPMLAPAGTLFGYVCVVDVLMDGHQHCGCYRSRHSETIYMFHPHDATAVFPVHHTEQDAMLMQVCEGGFGIPLPGFIVSMPHYISYGYLEPR
jgi:hypothetical protein